MTLIINGEGEFKSGRMSCGSYQLISLTLCVKQDITVTVPYRRYRESNRRAGSDMPLTMTKDRLGAAKTVAEKVRSEGQVRAMNRSEGSTILHEEDN